jgi:21S rRNA pseudouridine2819 synthase
MRYQLPQSGSLIRLYTTKSIQPLPFDSLEYQHLFKLVQCTKHYIVLNKAPGIAVQNDDIRMAKSKRQEGLFTILKQLDPSLKPVHRLDKVVSGGLLLARGKSAAQRFSRNLQRGGNSGYPFIRRYVALIHRDKISYSNNVFLHGDGVGEIRVPGITEEVTKFIISDQVADGYTPVVMELLTGKKHQLRRAMAHEFHSPILNDFLYGGGNIRHPRNAIALHSSLVVTKIGQNWQHHLVPVDYAQELWRGFTTQDGHFVDEIQRLLTDFDSIHGT